MINIKEKEFLNSALAPKEPTAEDLKKQKLKLQIEILEEKKRQQQQKAQQKQINVKQFKPITTKRKKSPLLYIFLLPIILAFSPLIILGWILIECTKAVK